MTLEGKGYNIYEEENSSIIRKESLLRVAEGIGPKTPGNLGALTGIKGAKSYRISVLKDEETLMSLHVPLFQREAFLVSK